MPSRYDIAKRLYPGRSGASGAGQYAAASSGGISGNGSQSLNMRYGVATANSKDGWVMVRLDTSGMSGDAAQDVRCSCDSPIYEGQRVCVLFSASGGLKAIPRGDNIVDEAVGEVSGQKVTAVMTQYAGSDSESDVPPETAQWSATWPDGHDYVWQRVVTVYEDGTRSISDPTCISRPTEGPDLSGVVTKVEVQYAGNNNPSSAPVSGWSGEMPTGYQCVWQRTSTTYGDGHVVNSTPALIRQDTGEDQMQTVYATSSTSASVAAKVATVQSGTMSLVEGAVVQVTFTNQNTASSPTLNVGGTGARSIRTLGTPYAYWAAGATVLFVYDGTYWQVASTPVYASTTTVGNPLDSNVYINSSGLYLRDGSSNLAAVLPDRIDLGLDSDVSEITLLQQMFAIRARDLGSASREANYLSIQPYDFGSSGATRGINIQVDNDTYLLVGDSSEIGSRAAVLQSLNNARIEGMDDCYVRAGGNAFVGGNATFHRTVALYKPAITIGGTSTISMTSSNKVLTATTEYGNGTPDTDSANTRIYRSGNYVYVTVPAAPYGKSAETVAVEVSASARCDSVSSSNFAFEVNMSGPASIPGWGSSIEAPITTGTSFVGGTVTPAIVELQQPSYGRGTYTYRFWCVARVSNATGSVSQWWLTVKML